MTKCLMCGYQPDRLPARTWTVEIEADYPSQNKLGGNHKTGWLYRRIRAGFSLKLKEQLNAIPAATKYRAAVITRVYGKTARGVTKRAYDEENLVGGGKPLIDTLRDYRVILDDTAGAWKGWYRQEKSPDGIDRVRIQLMEYAD